MASLLCGFKSLWLCFADSWQARCQGLCKTWKNQQVRQELDGLRARIWVSYSPLWLVVAVIVALLTLRKAVWQPDAFHLVRCLVYVVYILVNLQNLRSKAGMTQSQIVACHVGSELLIALVVACAPVSWDAADIPLELEMLSSLAGMVTLLDIRLAAPLLAVVHMAAASACSDGDQPGVTGSLLNWIISVLLCAAVELIVRAAVGAEMSARSLVSGFRGVLGACLEGDVILDPSFRILEASAGVERLLHEGLTGKSFLDFLDEQDRAALSAFVHQSPCSIKQGEAGKACSIPPCLRVVLRKPHGRVRKVDAFHVTMPDVIGMNYRHLLALKEDTEALTEPDWEEPTLPTSQGTLETGVGNAPATPTGDLQNATAVSSPSALSDPGQGLAMRWQDLAEIKYFLDARSELFDVLEMRLRFATAVPNSWTMPNLVRCLHPADLRAVRPRLVGCIWSSFDPARDPEATEDLGQLHVQPPGASGYLCACRAELGVVSGPNVIPRNGDNEPRPIYLGLRLSDFREATLHAHAPSEFSWASSSRSVSQSSASSRSLRQRCARLRSCGSIPEASCAEGSGGLDGSSSSS